MKKRPPVMTECEVKVGRRWMPCTIFEALTERDQVMRCKYCHGPVQALKGRSIRGRWGWACPQRLKPREFLGTLAARLKPCP